MRGLARLDAGGRMPGVDLARGLAVLGMFAAHLLAIGAFEYGDPATWVDLVNGRSSILFATLAGVSIGIVTGGARPVRGRARLTASLRLVVRAALLWLLGAFLILTRVPIANILPAYAILFLLALPFLALPAARIFGVAVVLGLVTPFLVAPLDAAFPALEPGGEVWALTGWNYPFVVWIAFVLAGLALARAGLGRLRTQVTALAGGATVCALGYGLGAAPAPVAWLAPVWTSEPHSSGVLEVLGSGGFAIAAIGVCCLACRTLVRTVVLPLRAVGSMPLTAYTVQVLVWWVVAAAVVGDVGDLFGIRDLGLFWYLSAGVVVGCTVWALTVGRGPVEWLLERGVRFVMPAPGPASTTARERIDA